MKIFAKIRVLFVLALISKNLYAQDHFSGGAGPAGISIYHSTNVNSHLIVSYDGYLHHCPDPNHAGPKGPEVLFIFHRDSDTKIFRRQMYESCPTPWNYNAPDNSQFSTSRGHMVQDQELWDLLLRVIYPIANDDIRLELAFVNGGSWDSDYGKNYPITFRKN